MLQQAPLKADRLKALESLAAACPGLEGDDARLTVLRALLAAFSDASEMLRQGAAEAIRANARVFLLTPDGLARVVYELGRALGPPTPREKSETVRGSLLKLLLRVFHTCGLDNSNLHLFLGELVQILVAQASDRSPENRVVCNKCIYKLATSYSKLSQFFTKEHVAQLTEALVSNYWHQRVAVRQSALAALQALHLTVMSEDLPKSVAQILPRCLSDPSPAVRLAFAQCCAAWLSGHIDRHVFSDVFCGPLLALLSDSEVGSDVFQLLLQAGESYESEHRDEFLLTKQEELPPHIRPYWLVVREYASAPFRDSVEAYWREQGNPDSPAQPQECRLPLGVRILSQKTAAKLMKATLADLTGWNEENRLRACSLLVTMLVLCENYVVRFTSDIVDAVLPFLLSSLRGYDSSPLASAVQLLFVLLRAEEVVAFLEGYQRGHDLTSRQQAVFLLLVRSLLDARKGLLDTGAEYVQHGYSLSLPLLSRLVSSTLSLEGLLFSEDREVGVAYSQAVRSLVLYLRVLLGATVSEADRASLRECGLLAPLALCALSAERMWESAAPGVSGTPAGEPPLRYVLSLSALSGVDALDEVFKGTIRILRQEADPQSVPRRIAAVSGLVQALPAAGKPPSFDQQMHSLLTKLVKLSDIERYAAPQRVAAAEAIEVLVRVQVREYPPGRSLILRYMEMLLPITTWKHGLRTPRCLECGIEALGLLLRALNEQDAGEAAGAPGSAGKDATGTQPLEEPLAGSLAGRVVGNLDSDSAGVRRAALRLAEALYRRLPVASSRELVYPLVCRLDDSDSGVTCQALLLGEAIYRWLVGRPEGSEAGERPLVSEEALGMLVLHLDDPCEPIAAECARFADIVLDAGLREDVRVLEARCTDALGRCVRRGVYERVASRARDLVPRSAAPPAEPEDEPPEQPDPRAELRPSPAPGDAPH